MREPEDTAALVVTVWSWAPPRLLECARYSAVTLTREARCGRCGFREGT